MNGYLKYLQRKSIKICGHVYSFTEEYNLARDNKCVGQSCGNNQTIKIDNSLPTSNKQSTLLHEIIEQLDYLLEIGLTHTQISALETGLFAVMVDNPDIFSCKNILEGENNEITEFGAI